MENRHVDALRHLAQAEAMWQADGHEPRSFLLIHRGGMKREIDHPRWDPSWSAPGEATIDDLQELGLLRVDPVDPSKNKARTFWVTMHGRETAATGADSIDRSPVGRSESPVAESPEAQSSVDPPKTAFVTWAHGNDEWEQTIAKFTFELRKLGIDADVDLFHMSDQEVNWATYGPKAIRSNEFVLIAASHEYKERWEETGNPHEGAGAAREANVLKTMFNDGRDEFYRSVKVVLLPGRTTKDIPDELGASAQHFSIETIDLAGLEGLLRTLTGQPAYVPPGVGRVPTLPPRFVTGSGVAGPDPGPATLEQVRVRLDELDRAVHDAPGDDRLAAERNIVEVALDTLRSSPERLSLGDSVWVPYELDLVHATVTSLEAGFAHQIEVQLDGGDKIVVDRDEMQTYPPVDD
jgi:hypothetical protein